VVQRVSDRIGQVRLGGLLGQALHQPGSECLEDRLGLGLPDNHALGDGQTADLVLDLIHALDPQQCFRRH
jgi:hypothetical protein